MCFDVCGTCSSKNEAYIPGIVFGYEFITQLIPFFSVVVVTKIPSRDNVGKEWFTLALGSEVFSS